MAATQSDVFNDFNVAIPAEVKATLLPHIIGGQGELHRYNNAAEKPGIALGAYISATPESYAWPSKSVNSLVDLTFVALFIDAALLNYYTDPEGSGDGTITAVGGFTNRIITSAADGFKANGISFPRLAALGDRDVQVGDVVHLKHTSSELYTSVRSLVANVVAASIGSATADAANPGTQGSSSNTTQTAGTVNDVGATDSIAAYKGYTSGFINETYTVLVTQGSSGGDATTAKVQITSGSGTDDQTGVSPAAFGSPFAIGTRGATLTFTHTSDDLLVGQTFLVTVHELFTAPTPVSGGTYTGTQTQTYIIQISRGGLYADPDQPQISVTSSLGIDQSGPTTVTAAGTFVPVGTQGVTIKFNTATMLRFGDKFYITATAPSTGAYKTIELNDNMSAGLIAAPDMLLELSIQKNIQIAAEAATPPTLNWTADQNALTVNAGIEAFDSTLTNGGVLFEVPVLSGPSTIMYAQYRAWSLAYAGIVGQLAVPTGSTAAAVVVPILGVLDPDNPLGFAVYKALQNSNGQTVSFTGLTDPTDINNWTDALAVVEGYKLESITPLSTDSAVLAAVQSHVDTQSSPDNGDWRVAWFSSQAVASAALITQDTTTDGQVALATLSDDPTKVGTQYTYLICTSGNAKFVTKGVRAGDTVRYLYSIDGFGNPTYTEFTVATVVNEDTLIFSPPGAGSAVAVAQKFEVWRNYTKNEQAANIAAQAQAYGDKRIRLIWPDQVDTPEANGVAGYFLAAGLAGFSAGIAPQQGMDNIPLSGFDGAPRSTLYFNNGQLNTLAAAGVFVVTQDVSGNVFVLHPLTTDQSSTENGLETVVRTDDAIDHVLYNRVSASFGATAVTDAGLVIIRSEIEQGLFVLQSGTFVQRVGASMVLDYQVTSVRPGVLPDSIVVQATVVRPFPVEQLTLTLTFALSI